MSLDYFYDGQIPRYIEQFGRIFSTIKYTSGTASDGTTIYRTVPAIPAPTDTQVAYILSGGSENVISVLPMFAYYITDMKVSNERRQNPHYVRQIGVGIRELDTSTGLYTSKMGNEYMVENYMPVPYDATFRLDLWYSSEFNRMELTEQIQMLFNPMIDIQTNRNELDWSSLTTVELTDIMWNPIQYGAQTNITKKVMSFIFRVPIWINPPSKVKKSTKISEIIVSVNQASKSPIEDETGTLLSRTVVTPGNFDIKVSRDYDAKNSYKIKLMIDKNDPKDDYDTNWDWPVLLQRYGQLNSTSELLLMTNLTDLHHSKTHNDSAYDDTSTPNIIAGTISENSIDSTILDWTVDPDTLPQYYNPVIYIDGIIDPTKREPVKTNGIVYLILNTIPQGSEIWGTIYENGNPIDNIDGAVENDVLQYDGTKWNKIFNSIENQSGTFYGQYNCNGDPLTFDNGRWRLTIDGVYDAGYWRLQL